MKMVTVGLLAAAVLLGAIPVHAGGFDVQNEGNIFLSEVAQIPQMHDPDKFRRVVRMRFAIFTLAYTTNTPIFSGKKFDVSAHPTNADYGKAAQIIKSMMSEQPPSANPALAVLKSIVDDCATTSNRRSD